MQPLAENEGAIKSVGQITAKRKQASALQTPARAPKLPDFAERLVLKLASAFGSERLSDSLNRTPKRTG